MATHDLYKRIAEELKKDPNFWDRHSSLIDEAYEKATASEKRLLNEAMQITRKDKLLTELSVRLLSGEDELSQRQSVFIGSKNFREMAKPMLDKIFQEAYEKQGEKHA